MIWLGLPLCAQDKIYLLTGECLKGKVTEIRADSIRFLANGNAESLNTGVIFLISYANGKTELFNSPREDLLYTQSETETKIKTNSSEATYDQNQISINTLALCNADVALFYEHIKSNNKLGFGIMGAYNFNVYVNPPNRFLFILNNAKKLYDLGAFVNFYPSQLSKKNNFYCGFMLKYLFFRFQSASGDSTNIVYTPATGSQLATLFHVGSHSIITPNFYIKTLLGIGAFNLRGEYKQQFNYIVNHPNGSAPATNYTFGLLPKMYVGFNVGFNF